MAYGATHRAAGSHGRFYVQLYRTQRKAYVHSLAKSYRDPRGLPQKKTEILRTVTNKLMKIHGIFCEQNGSLTDVYGNRRIATKTSTRKSARITHIHGNFCGDNRRLPTIRGAIRKDMKTSGELRKSPKTSAEENGRFPDIYRAL